ncbi:MAG: hypothetical protein C4335_13280 [Armatimonadota bacterium]
MSCKPTFSTPPFVALLALSLCLLCFPLQAQTLSITLLNGDCDGDNEVTLTDLGILVAALGSMPGDENWNPDADLDGDGEVTLMDYAILVRNFGQIGSDPFNPSLPRQPAPTEGVAYRGVIGLEDWLGEQRTVCVEALREDDPTQTVYTIQAQSGEPFTFYLPQSGLWRLRVTGVRGFLIGQGAAMRVYGWTPRMQAFFVVPQDGEAFADRSHSPTGIGILVHVVDHDNVALHSSDRSKTFWNYERSPSSHFVCTWQVEDGGGGIIRPGPPGTLTAEYIPPTLRPDEPSREVFIRCTIRDIAPDPLRRDEDLVLPPLRILVVNRPTVHITVGSADRLGNIIVSNALIPSGMLKDCYALFEAYSRKGAWTLDRAIWVTPWGTWESSGNEYGMARILYAARFRPARGIVASVLR